MFKKKFKKENQLNLIEEIENIKEQEIKDKNIKQINNIKQLNNDQNKQHGVKIGMDGIHIQQGQKIKILSESQVKFRNEIMQLKNDVVDINMEKFIKEKLKQLEQIQMGTSQSQTIQKENETLLLKRQNSSRKEDKNILDINLVDQTVQQKTIMIQGLREVICPFEEKVRNLEVIENLKRKRLFETINVDKVLNQEKSKKQQKFEKYVQKQFGKFFQNDGRMKRTLLMKRQIENWKYEKQLQDQSIINNQDQLNPDQQNQDLEEG